MQSPEEPLTAQVTAPELVTLALFVLGGGATVVDTEDVAVKAHEIAPGRFSWRKYPEQINLELVRVALSDAGKPERALVAGTGKSGWSLTAAGQKWAEARGSQLLGHDMTKSRTERSAGSIDERRWQRERARVLASEAWRLWNTDGSPISREAAHDLFRIDRYVTGRARELKVNRVRALFTDDDDLVPFVEAAATVALTEERLE